MPIDLQAKLLRVLEERVVRRLGGAKSIPVDFRLLSSTNRSPEQAVKEGQLRQDLYFRINTVTIGVPPLRERREDLPMLVRAFLERYRAKHQRPVEGIEPEAYRRLLSLRVAGQRARAAARARARGAGRARPRGHAGRSAGVAAARRAGEGGSAAASRRRRCRRARWRRSSAPRSSRRWTPRAGTSRPPPRCWVCAARRSTRRCASTTSRSAGLDYVGAPNGPPNRASARRAPAEPGCSSARLARPRRWGPTPNARGSLSRGAPSAGVASTSHVAERSDSAPTPTTHRAAAIPRRSRLSPRLGYVHGIVSAALTKPEPEVAPETRAGGG